MENMDMSELPEPVARIIAKMVEEPKLQLGKPEATKPPSPGDLRPLLGFYLCSPDTTVSAHSAGRQGR